MTNLFNKLLALASIIILLIIIGLFLLLIYYSFTGHKILIDKAEGFYISQRGEEDFISNILDSYIFSIIFKSYLFSFIIGIAPKFIAGPAILTYAVFFFVYIALLLFIIIIGLLTMKRPLLSTIIFGIATIFSLPLILGIVTSIIPILLGILTYRMFRSLTLFQFKTTT